MRPIASEASSRIASRCTTSAPRASLTAGGRDCLGRGAPHYLLPCTCRAGPVRGGGQAERLRLLRRKARKRESRALSVSGLRPVVRVDCRSGIPTRSRGKAIHVEAPMSSIPRLFTLHVMYTHGRLVTCHHGSDAGWMSTVKRLTILAPAAVALLVGCQDSDGPTAPHLATVPAAAVGGSGLTAPSNASALASSATRIDISWQDRSFNETGFELHRSTTGVSGTFTLLTTVGANVTTSSDQGLAPSTQFCYRVRAVRAKGSTVTSAFSNTACATTPAPPPPPPPAAASGTTALPLDSSSVSISWTDYSTNEEGFRLYRSIDGGAVWDSAGTVAADNQDWVGHDPQAEQRVCYRVVAFNAGGDAAPSNMACTVPPAAPTDLTLTMVDVGLFDLTWNDNSAVEDGYEVWLDLWWGYCCSAPGACNAGGVGSEWLVAELPANATSYRTTGSSSACESYSFYVVAKKDGYSASSDVVTVP